MKLKLNKKGGAFSGWAEAILLSIAFVSIIGIVIVTMNGMYNKNYSIGLTDNTTQSLFVEYVNTSTQNLQGGDVLFGTVSGITLKSSWSLVLDLLNAIWTFFSGGWIDNIFAMLNLGAGAMIIAVILKLLFYISLVFGALYLLFRVWA